MTIRVDSSPLIAGKVVVSLFSGHGIQSQNIPSTGTSGAGYLFNDIAAQSMSATDEVRGELLTLPSAGNLVVNEDSSFTFSAPDGTYNFTYRGFRNGVTYGDYTVTLEIGSDTPVSENIVKSSVTISNKGLGLSLGVVGSVNKSTISYNGKLLTSVTGNEVPLIISLNPSTLTYSPKEFSVVAGTSIPSVVSILKNNLVYSSKTLVVVTGVNEGINVPLGKGSYSIVPKTLALGLGSDLSIGKSSLNINYKEFFLPPTSYPIFDSSRIYFIKKNKQSSFNM
jgi:hypothetical protein